MVSQNERLAIRRRQAFEEAAKRAEEYGEINFQICGDNIILDPLLRGEAWTEANVEMSNDCAVQSTIYSAKYHACRELAEQFRDMACPSS